MHTPRSGFLKRLAAASLLVAAAGAAQAQSQAWTALDYSLAGGAVTLMALDWAQTRYGARNPSRYAERNPMMGEHPSSAKVDRYFTAASLLTAGVALVLPATQRRLFLGSVIVVETSVVFSNHQIGVKFDF
jgi:hypothetical protein